MLFTNEHRALSESVKKFVATQINPYVDEWEKEGIFPAHELFKKMGDKGFLGIAKPEQFGGMGLDWSYNLAFCEAMGEVNGGSIPMAVGVQTDMATPALAKQGSDALREEFLVPAIAGDYVACIGVSEPGAGSDVASIRTHARKDGDDYIINGGKMWITNGTQADFMCLLANTGDGPVHKNKSLIVLPLKSKGVTIARKLDKLGMRASDTAEIWFEDVRVPQRYRIGEEGMGFIYQMQQFQEERLWGAACNLRYMDIAVQDVITYTRDRQAFGKSLLDNQVVHFRLAELQTEIEALRSMVYRAVEQMINGEDVTYLASMAKLKTGRLCREVADSCLQYYGGMGFMNETPITRMYRDTRLTSIGGGADEVMLGIIAKFMGTFPDKR
ncbi:acyl-CoA dehydrogenase family protein [Alloalcanivorax xenomutans]|jgi:citronellyl-CoA dehydrogenase|uniref:acyl-CoA dehydrogenase family protein n=1 Tax=Alloalcanivorax xenomutans TaxID=1094342 RepID=UPI0003B873C9|nr:acyl-CoA dehydrogenase family protein [Alloalcanivorax xenomutans]ERS10570.1 acyl-CoA dehydrogenase [Alcanivorax sp. PN-3]PHS67063.1 MAG: acyl-CoA dehydrogenase [Alcanivorax sp.]WOD28904.1 acyl-CoA dehydrogenase family protein [Alloalcanivorax xenomutans]CUR45878.1 Citronellyl-CoA dehydrogenase [Alloalcanivorax xenomutans]SOC05699.1 citronellyl-CoA dehydrogenase [Alloalcanivorax xenomutans]|tara:strand:- start:2075 stop:3229 length:1155 start_codon:yes stop_codon:yes gene_type:complete